MPKFKPGDTVAFSQAHVRRLGFDALLATVRGVIIGDPYADNRQLRGKFVRVDFPQWPDVDGHTARTIAASNLTPVMRDGVVFGD